MLGRTIAETDKDGNVTAQNIWGHKPLARKINGKYYYYLYNGHGDVVKIADESGNIVNRYKYDEWGNILEKEEQIENPIKYAGEYFDEESGMYYLRARYYDPVIGRFVSKDSYEGKLTNPLSMNQYIYCVNNPLGYVDPSGHRHIVSNYSFTTYKKEYGYGVTGRGYRLKPIHSTLRKHEFTNLNISVFESGKYTSILGGGTEITGYHNNAQSAAKGEITCAIDEEGTYYLDIESLIYLDREYGWKKLWAGGKTTLSFVGDTVVTLSGYKAVTGTLKAGKPMAVAAGKGVGTMLIP